jgi:hypothetical protein
VASGSVRLAEREVPARRSRPDRWREVALGALALAILAGPARGDDPTTAALTRALSGEPPEVVEQLLEEKVVVLPAAEKRAGEPALARALVLFAKPRARVIQLMLQIDRQAEYRPELEKLETVERSADGAVAEQEMRIMLKRIRFWLRYHWDVPAGRISWTLDPRFPNDLRVVEGLWELQEVDAEHTMGRTSTQVDVGTAIPSSLQEIATRKNLRGTVDRCRRWVDSDGQYRP